MKLTAQKVIIYSVGLLGGSLGLALKHNGFTGEIIGISSPKNIKTALELKSIDKGYHYDNLPNILEERDILILCSPITGILDTIKKLSKLTLPQNLIITDVGSTKNVIMECAASLLPSHVHFIGGHPMAGSEKSGPAAADPFLFENAVYALTSYKDKVSHAAALGEFLQHYLRCSIIHLDPKNHDRITATVSHVPHIVASALVNTAQWVNDTTPNTLTLAAGGFRDLTRIASSPYTMWHDIFLTNKNSMKPILEHFIDELNTMSVALNKDTLKDSFVRAAKTRDTVPHTNKGILSSVYEVLLIAEDTPGYIARFTTILANKNINIKDIELLKIREGEHGTIKLAFADRQTAQEAINLLTAHKITAWERT